MLKPVLLAALLSPLAIAAPAQAACRSPAAPACVAGKGAFSSDAEEKRCKAEVDAYRARTKSYTACRITAVKAELAAIEARAKRNPHAEDYVAEVNGATDRAQREGEAAIARYNAAADAFRVKYVATARQQLNDVGLGD